MASIKGGLIKAIKSFSKVASLAGGRCYANAIPQGEDKIPCVVVRLETKDRNQHLGGFDGSLIFEEFAIRAYAWDSDTATQIGNDFAEELESIEGDTLTDANNANGRVLGSVFLIDEEDDVEFIGQESDRLLHYYELQVQVEHSPVA